jgi:hypothetical protein
MVKNKKLNEKLAGRSAKAVKAASDMAIPVAFLGITFNPKVFLYPIPTCLLVSCLLSLVSGNL